VPLSEIDRSAVEKALSEQRGSAGWERTPDAHDLQGNSQRYAASWKIDIPTAYVTCPNVDHIVVSLDKQWPISQVAVTAPQAPCDYSWPHIDSTGNLCLKPTRIECDTVSRVLDSINWAIVLLNYDENKRQREFEREFLTYWATSTNSQIRFLSLVRPATPSRMVTAYCDGNLIFVAESKSELKRWLENRAGKEHVLDKRLLEIPYIWTEHPWAPPNFPQHNEDIYRLLRDEFLDAECFWDSHVPILVGTNTPNGPCVVGVQLNQQPPPQIRRKFRRPGRISASVRRNSAANYPIERCVASRVDGEWIHGRGKDQNYSSLANTRLAFIGCGALGSNLSRLLMQAGVGECLFVDHDTFESHNIYRHILGHSWIGANKAAAMAKQLRSDFPHCRSTSSINSKFENLSSPQLDILAEFDILISAGIPIETEAAISAWRLSLDDPIPQISSWIEPFGVAGHSVVIMDEDSLLDKYNADYQYIHQISQWPESVQTVEVEPGCGNYFQPHTAAELLLAVNMSYRQTIELINGTITSSLCDVSIGDLSKLTEHGGSATENNLTSFSYRRFPWAETEKLLQC
jgi:hypothetical protein